MYYNNIYNNYGFCLLLNFCNIYRYIQNITLLLSCVTLKYNKRNEKKSKELIFDDTILEYILACIKLILYTNTYNMYVISTQNIF